MTYGSMPPPPPMTYGSMPPPPPMTYGSMPPIDYNYGSTAAAAPATYGSMPPMDYNYNYGSMPSTGYGSMYLAEEHPPATGAEYDPAMMAMMHDHHPPATGAEYDPAMMAMMHDHPPPATGAEYDPAMMHDAASTAFVEERTFGTSSSVLVAASVSGLIALVALAAVYKSKNARSAYTQLDSVV